MPNYSLVANTQFKARNFDDMIRPYVMYTQEYRAQEDAIADLATKADVWAGLANEQTDPVAYAQYTNYANALKDQAAIMADRGLNPSSRQAMLNLKRRYSSEIVPIEQAYTARKAQAEEQRKALLQNPTLMMSRRADTTSLDRYMENPNLGYESYSGALLTQQAGQAAAAIAKELRDYGKGKPLDGFTRTWLQQHGYTAAEVAFAINHPDDPRASSVLNTIVNNVIADSGMTNWADNKTLNQAYNYARQGLWQAVGQTQVGTYTDQAAVMAAQEAMQKRAEIRAKKAARQRQLQLSLTPNFDRRNVRTSKEVGAVAQEAKDWEKYKKYFYKNANGNWVLNSKGRKVPLTKIIGGGTNVSSASYITDSDFGRFIKKHGLSGMYNGKVGSGQTATIDKMIDRINNTYDANIATEYLRGVDPSQYDNVIAVLNRSAHDGKVYNYDRTKSGNSYSWNRGKEVEVNELTNADIKSATTVFGKHGNYLEVKLKDGTTLNVPASSYTSNYSNMMAGNAGTIEGYRAMLADGKTHYKLPTGEVLPIESLINSELNAMGDNFMSSLGLSQVNPMKVDRGEYTTQVY